MSKRIVPSREPDGNAPDNGQVTEQSRGLPLGDAYEPEGPPEASFDIDEIEAPPAAQRQTAVPPKATSPDPFDPDSLRLPQDFGASLGVKKVLTTVPARKPDKTWWVRVHSSEKYALQTACIELKEDRELYLVAPSLWQSLAGESTFSPRAFFTAINRQGVLFLWQARLPGVDGKLDSWSQSALEAAQKAKKGWVRVAANMSLGAYDVWETTAELSEPEWPEMPFRELLAISFKGKVIDSWDHAVLRKLHGEV